MSEHKEPRFEEAITYDVAFDLSNAGVRHLPFCFSPLLLTLAGVTGLCVARKMRFAQYRYWLFAAAAALGIVLSASFLLANFREYRSLVLDYREGRTEFVEGKVENFSPMPFEGHRDETFDVRGQQFKYSDYSLSAGFNNTQSHGGPIRDGIRVKIWYEGNTIIHLEVERPQRDSVR